MIIPFNKPYLTGNEYNNIKEAYINGQFSGDGSFTKLCNDWFKQETNCNKALLTHSCTAALEMAAILAEIKPGDEVIMPSYTFVSTANAFVLRGAIPVFVDIRSDTLNIDESLIEAAITKKTRAIVPVHYAGIACEMDEIMRLAKKYSLIVIEDAAQALNSYYKGKKCGSIGNIGCYSFHETKNIISGEGGALLINDPNLADRSEIIWEKGTNRKKFISGQIDKYTWVDIGSSFLPGEITAAFLWAQIQELQLITNRRLSIWNKYNIDLEILELSKRVKRPVIPINTQQNGHMYYLLLKNLADRTKFIEAMKKLEIYCAFHYVPLHTSPMGKTHCRSTNTLPITSMISEQLVRLPMWIGVEDYQDKIIKEVKNFLIKNN